MIRIRRLLLDRAQNPRGSRQRAEREIRLGNSIDAHPQDPAIRYGHDSHDELPAAGRLCPQRRRRPQIRLIRPVEISRKRPVRLPARQHVDRLPVAHSPVPRPVEHDIRERLRLFTAIEPQRRRRKDRLEPPLVPRDPLTERRRPREGVPEVLLLDIIVPPPDRSAPRAAGHQGRPDPVVEIRAHSAWVGLDVRTRRPDPKLRHQVRLGERPARIPRAGDRNRAVVRRFPRIQVRLRQIDLRQLPHRLIPVVRERRRDQMLIRVQLPQFSRHLPRPFDRDRHLRLVLLIPELPREDAPVRRISRDDIPQPLPVEPQALAVGEEIRRLRRRAAARAVVRKSRPHRLAPVILVPQIAVVVERHHARDAAPLRQVQHAVIKRARVLVVSPQTRLHRLGHPVRVAHPDAREVPAVLR